MENTEFKEILDESARIIKEAKIDDLYLARIGFNTSKKSGCCPIHGGDSKSAFSYTDKKGYRQYSCWTLECIGKGVDIIHLCKVKEKLGSQYEAIKFLADMFNIELPKYKKKYTKKEKTKKYAINKLKEFKQEKEAHLKSLQKEAFNKKDVDKAFCISTLIDELKINTLESKNYSKYKATKTYNVNKYISENEEGLELAINQANKGEKVLLIAPTGSGKTYSIVNKYIKNKKKACFIVPNASIVEQVVNEYNIPGAFGDKLNQDKQLEKNNIVAFTWDKFSNIKSDLSEDIAIVDEIHQTFNDMYRRDKIRGLYSNLEQCRGRIDITATPNKLDINIYDTIIEYKQKIQTKYNINLYKNVNDDKILEIINNSKKFALLKDDTKYLEFIKSRTNKITEVVNSTVKDESKTYDEIITNSCIKNIDGLLNTSVIIAGVNIKDDNITDIIIIGKKDIATIKQYIARFRNLNEVNIHIFNNYKDTSNTFQLEWEVNKKIEQTNEVVRTINYFNYLQFKQETLSITPIRLEEGNNFYYDSKTKEYKLDIVGIRNEVYMKYYNNADIVSFRCLLKEYFEDVNIVNLEKLENEEIKEFKQDLKEQEEESILELEQFKNILVGANEILKNKITPKLNYYLVCNNLSEKHLLEQFNKYNIASLLKIARNKTTIDLYTKYVVENSFTYEVAWCLATSSNRKKGQIFEQLNLIVYRKVSNEYKQLIDEHLVENRIYNLVLANFRPGVSYTKEHLESFVDLIKATFKNIKFSATKLGSIINNTYIVQNKRHKFSTLHQLDYIYYKNMNPNWCNDTEKSSQISINTIKGFKEVEDIVSENKWTEGSKKGLEYTIDKRFKLITESDQAKMILNINKIFNS